MNISSGGSWESSSPNDLLGDPLYIVVPMTVFYSAIFVSGVVGNVSTCVVITRNRHMHTATNYYLFSLAVSDVLLLISGLPQEMYQLWSKQYVFGGFMCVLNSYLAETCANATVLTITAFTVERYVAICHPFLSHTFSKLSRAIKFVIAIWLSALVLAIPQANQFGLIEFADPAQNGSVETLCSMISTKSSLIHTFVISTLVFFVLPMTLITGLYILIGIKLRRSRLMKRPHETQCVAHQNRVIRMLVAVVVAFFICWAPFHAQRLLAVYAEHVGVDHDTGTPLESAYKTLTYLSGILYYLNTTVNPLLYNIMSHKFRQAFKVTLAQVCGKGEKVRQFTSAYSVLSRQNTQRRIVVDMKPVTLINHTISNSSLQDVPQEEFNSSELAQVMSQINGR